MTPAAGTDHFWQEAYQDHGPAVMAFLMRRVRGRAEAEDLLQETFVRAMRVDSFQRGSNVRAYLMSIARNLWINKLRRPRLVVAAEPSEPDGQQLADVAGSFACADDEAGWIFFRQHLDRALDEMPTDHRRAFELAVVDQHSYSEVSRITGWSLPRVKSNVYRARRRLVEQLEDQLPGSIGPRGSAS